jgi:hypothetical protein
MTVPRCSFLVAVVSAMVLACSVGPTGDDVASPGPQEATWRDGPREHVAQQREALEDDGCKCGLCNCPDGADPSLCVTCCPCPQKPGAPAPYDVTSAE